MINKFGGASVRDAESVEQMAKICQSKISNGVIVVSAMGKTTNLLEKLVQCYYVGEDCKKLVQRFYVDHHVIITDLFVESKSLLKELDLLVAQLMAKLSQASKESYDYEYDQIVPFGEIISTKIVHAYLQKLGHKCTWVDARTVIKTDSTYREAKIDWETTAKLVKDNLTDINKRLYITQGFIGADNNGKPTTLGREGSDFTAAVFAKVLDSKGVTVWKDVPGILCADPNWLPGADKLEKLSYYEAIELAFYGAKVIHPKTMKPLKEKNIPLEIRSFLDVDQPGTLIDNFESTDLPPVYIQKTNQVLISIQANDYSFIIEENMSHIIGVLAKHRIKVNMMQNSAVSFSIAVDGELIRVKNAIAELKETYRVKYNDALELVTIRHYKEGAENKVIGKRTILVQQQSRTVARYLLR